MSPGFVIPKANGFFEFFNWLIEPPHPSEAHSHVKMGLILLFWFSKILKSCLKVQDTFVKFIQLCLYLCSVKKEFTVWIIFLNGRFIVTQGIIVLTQLVVTLTRKVPMLSNLLWIGPLFWWIYLYCHCVVENRTCKFSSAMMYTSTELICLSMVYNNH